MWKRWVGRYVQIFALAVLLGAVLAWVVAEADTTVAHAGPPPGNSAWVYDALYQNGHRHGDLPGSFAAALNRYNAGTPLAHAITRVFTYAGSLEMYCSDDGRRCQPQDLKVIFGADGRRSIAAYAERLQAVDGQPPAVVAVIDGSIRAKYPGSLHGFDQLTPDLARAFADKVARSVCADPQVAGVQFDLEPFSVSKKNGQYYFYERIAADFAGDVGPRGDDAFHCVDTTHPHGRYFSVFGAAHDLDPKRATGRHLQHILTAHHNGFSSSPCTTSAARRPGIEIRWLYMQKNRNARRGARRVRLRNWVSPISLRCRPAPAPTRSRVAMASDVMIISTRSPSLAICVQQSRQLRPAVRERIRSTSEPPYGPGATQSSTPACVSRLPFPRPENCGICASTCNLKADRGLPARISRVARTAALRGGCDRNADGVVAPRFR